MSKAHSCKNLSTAFYSVDNKHYLWCHGDESGTKGTCIGGTVCKCGRTVYNPCIWDFQTLPDCEKEPGDFFDPTIPDKPNCPDKPVEPEKSEQPEQPVIPEQSSEPNQSEHPEIPEQSLEPSEPEIPTQSSESEQPSKPIEPIEPKNPKRKVAYYTNWSQYRLNSINGWACKFTPTNIDPHIADVINFAFAVFDETYTVKGYEWNDDQMIPQVVALKSRNPKLQVLTSIGGWNFNFFESTKHLFTQMAETFEGRKKFIESSIAFARRFNLDGIDIDWEYPGNPDQGGRPIDKQTFTLLLKEFREQIDKEAISTGRKKLLLTIAAPAGPQNIKNMEIDKYHQYLDWINLMTYDLHGAWENVTGSHTALYATDGLSVNDAVNHYLSAGVPKAKLVVGLGHYGRGWTLQSENDHQMGSPTIGASKMGTCTGENGYLSKYEIDHFIPPENIRFDEASKTYYGWKGDQFYSFDTIDSFKYKTDYICKMNLGGVMSWSLDLDKDYVQMKFINSQIDNDNC
jgi:chitinase